MLKCGYLEFDGPFKAPPPHTHINTAQCKKGHWTSAPVSQMGTLKQGGSRGPPPLSGLGMMMARGQDAVSAAFTESFQHIFSL